MRVAVVLQAAYAGGVVRFTKSLIDGMLAADPEVEIGFFVDARLASLERLEEHFQDGRVMLFLLSDPRVAAGARGSEQPMRTEDEKSVLWRAVRDLLKKWPALRRLAQFTYTGARAAARGEHSWQLFSMPPEAISALSDYDVVYLALPLWCRPFECDRAMAGTFHDLNYVHFPLNFSKRQISIWKHDYGFWTGRVERVIASTKFIEGEILEYYPQAKGKTRVVYLAPYGYRSVSAEATSRALEKFGLARGGYVVYPCNLARHKNVSGFVLAAAELKRTMGEVSPMFVLTGIGTDALHDDEPNVDAAFLLDLMRSNQLVLGEDILSLGYVSDEEVDALIVSSALVVSTSLYEAGCGPAMDAWQTGVPVAMSRIAPFVEQLDVLGVEALVFDPEDPTDIAAKILWALEHPVEMRAMAQRSQESMESFSYEDVGRNYLAVFREAIEVREEKMANRR
jgi:glycosyltransferase involved in cell wall biosynthesis